MDHRTSQDTMTARAWTRAQTRGRTLSTQRHMAAAIRRAPQDQNARPRNAHRHGHVQRQGHKTRHRNGQGPGHGHEPGHGHWAGHGHRRGHGPADTLAAYYRCPPPDPRPTSPCSITSGRSDTMRRPTLRRARAQQARVSTCTRRAVRALCVGQRRTDSCCCRGRARFDDAVEVVERT